MEMEHLLQIINKFTSKSNFKPHKHIALLAIIDCIHNQDKKENKFYYDEYKNYFSAYFKKYGRTIDSNRPHTPFYHLKSSGFWKLAIKEGREEAWECLKTAGSTKDIVDNVLYAYLSEPAYKLLSDKNNIVTVKNYIISILERNVLMKEQPKTVLLSKKEKNPYILEVGESLFQHEEKAINEICKGIKDIGKAASNILLYEKQTKAYYEYDMILVTRTGIFVIELKHWSGSIQIKEYSWILNNYHYRNDPHKANSQKCKVLKGIYQHYFRTFPDLWVESVVVFTNPDARIDGADFPGSAVERNRHNVTFVAIQDFLSYLRKKEAVSKVILTDLQVNSIVQYLYSLNQPKHSNKYEVSGYETIEYITQKLELIELIARPLYGRARGLYRFRIFRTPYNLAEEEKNRLRKKAYNTLDVVSAIGNYPYIHKVWVHKNEIGDIIEGSEWSETGTLQDFILQKKGVFALEEALHICYCLALALKKAHENGIIHRAVKPANILIINKNPRLMNFDLSYHLEGSNLTVIEDPSKLKDDGYIAPEIINGQDIDEGTDYFSLGAIACELLTGEKPCSSTRFFMAQGGFLNEKMLIKMRNTGVTQEIIEVIKKMVVFDWQMRLKNAEQILEVFSLNQPEKAEKQTVGNDELLPGNEYDVYKIVRLIDVGAESQIYLADTYLKQVILKVFNREVPRERVYKEAEISSKVESPYIISCNDKVGYWKKNRYFIEMEYVPGNSMRSLINKGNKPDIPTFIKIALCLMEAVDAFHNFYDEGEHYPLLHSDIKPDNIILTEEEDKAVLIDCGIAGNPRIDTYQGTTGYVPPDSIRGTDMQFDQGGDLFSLGVTLWEWLWSVKPYDNPSIDDIPEIPKNDLVIPEHIRKWLLKAVATRAENRFVTIKEMREALVEKSGEITDLPGVLNYINKEPIIPNDDEIELTEDVGISKGEAGETGYFPPIENPFVTYLNTLSNVSAGNEHAMAEAQVEEKLFSHIVVENPLASLILKELVDNRKNVILTGNAGDGKTTIALEIVKMITNNETYTKLRPVEELTQSNLVIVKDMSELKESERPSIIKKAAKCTKYRYLIVSNSGTLLQSLKSLNINGVNTDQSEVLRALRADKPEEILGGHFLVLNIGRMNSISTAVKVFKRMLEEENWSVCQECGKKDSCPILFNVKLIQEKKETVCRQITYLYWRLFEYDTRLTMRQMTGHLAYTLTAGKGCLEINEIPLLGQDKFFLGSLFYNRFFGDDGKIKQPEALQMLPIREIINTEFGTILDPSFERRAWLKEGSSFKMFESLSIKHPTINDFFNTPGFSTRKQLRRLVYFLGEMDDKASSQKFVTTYLRSPMLLEFLKLSEGNQEMSFLEESNYRTKILQVLQETFIGMRLPEGSWEASTIYITLNRKSFGTGTQMVLASFNKDDFYLKMNSRYKVGNEDCRIILLIYKDGEVGLELDLPFLDYVARRYEGEVAEELSPYYADRIESFKVKLLSLNGSERNGGDKLLRLIRIDPNRNFKEIKVIPCGDKLEVVL